MARIAALCVSLALLVPALSVAAEDKDEAEKHFKAGLTLLKSEDYAGAASEFETSVRIYPTRGGLYNLANMYKALHRYDEALEALARLRREYEGQIDAGMEEEASRLEAEIRSVVGEISVVVEPAGAKILLDGREVGTAPLTRPLVVGPGPHEILASLDGYSDQKVTVTATSGAKVEQRLRLARAQKPSSPTSTPQPQKAEPVVVLVPGPSAKSEPQVPPGPPALFWAGLAGTVVAGALMGTFWGLAVSSRGDYDGESSKYEDVQASPGSYTRAQADGIYKDMAEARDDAALYNKVAIGMTAVTGALAVATAVVLGLDLTGPADVGESKSAVAATPGGVRVSF